MAKHPDLVTTALHTPFNAGTSFPGSPVTDDKYYRTDRNLLYYYDGTRWLTTQLFESQLAQEGLLNQTGTGTLGYFPSDGTYGMYLVDMIASVFVNGTNNGSNFWDIVLAYVNSANTATTIATISTSADAGSTWLRKSVTIGAVAHADTRVFRVRPAETGAAGNVWAICSLRFRYIG